MAFSSSASAFDSRASAESLAAFAFSRAAFEVVIEKSPESTWVAKARSHLGDLSRRADRHAEAAALYRQRVELMNALVQIRYAEARRFAF